MSISFDIFRGSQDGRIVPDKTTRVLQPHEAYVEITHSGLCGSDEHFLKSGNALGHEGVGIVRKLGKDVRNLRLGDRVGFGLIHYVCGNCEPCLTGWDQYCPHKRQYGTHDFDLGSFGEGTVWDSRCLVPIPDGYDSADAAPLMCAGATVWTVLTEYGLRPTDRIGIMGLGGLGHLAIKLAAAMGCHVVAISRSDAKRAEALRFGASEYHIFQPGGELNFEPVKHLLLCGSGGVDYACIIPLMEIHGSIYPLTLEFSPSSIPSFPMIAKGLRVQGSMVASRHSLRGLLQFAAEKQVVPSTMKFPLTCDGVENAMKTLREGRMRYRGVLVRP